MTETNGQQGSEPARHARAGFPAGVGAVITAFAAAALMTGALIAMREPVTPSRYVAEIRADPGGDRARGALATRLARCRAATADTVDAECCAAWDAQHRHFTGRRTGRRQQER